MNSISRHEVIMTGIGGKGVLLAGQLLAGAGMEQYQYAMWTPTYFAAMRSGPCECTVVLSDCEVASPVLSMAGVVMVFEGSQLAAFERRVKPGGLLIVESAGMPQPCRNDHKLLKVPATEIAVGMGDSRASNMVLLGAYLSATSCVSPGLVEEELKKKFGGNIDAFSLNREALRKGLSLAA